MPTPLILKKTSKCFLLLQKRLIILLLLLCRMMNIILCVCDIGTVWFYLIVAVLSKVGSCCVLLSAIQVTLDFLPLNHLWIASRSPHDSIRIIYRITPEWLLAKILTAFEMIIKSRHFTKFHVHFTNDSFWNYSTDNFSFWI